MERTPVLSATIRQRLKARRRALGITQADAARRIGWDQGSLSKYENGQIGADIDTAAALARAYGLTLAELVEEPAAKDADRDALLVAYARLSADARRRLLAMLEAVAPARAARTSAPAPPRTPRRAAAAEPEDDARQHRRGTTKNE